MVRDAHRPAEDGVFGGSVASGDFIDFISRNAALRSDFIPRDFYEPPFEFRPTLAMAAQKGFVMCTAFDNTFRNAGHQRQVAADMWLNIKARDLTAEQ